MTTDAMIQPIRNCGNLKATSLPQKLDHPPTIAQSRSYPRFGESQRSTSARGIFLRAA
jgi:hypothetical protein